MTVATSPTATVDTGSDRRGRQLTGWRMWLVLLAPFVAIQLIHNLFPTALPARLVTLTEDEAVPFRSWANSFFDYLRQEEFLGLFSFRDFTRSVSSWLSWPLDFSEGLLASGDGPLPVGPIPWLTMFVLLGLLGYWLGGRWLAVLGSGTIAYLAVVDAWEDSMITLSIVLVCAPLAAMIGWALGLAAARSRRFESVLIPVLNVMQSLPHFSYLVPIAVFVGIGDEAGAIATILFAIPPMARLTILGLRGVSSEVLEAGRMAGSSSWQMLWKVEMPSALPSLMVGVNQVIMQCFGMTVLASFVGTRGLGLPLLNFLQSIQIGKALQLGVAIVLLAITLDRFSQAAGARKPERIEGNAGFLARHSFLVGGAVAGIATVALARIFPALHLLPEEWTIDTSDFWDDGVSWIVRELNGVLGVLRDFLILEILFPVRDAFLAVPWIGFVVLVAMIGWYIGGLRLAAIVGSLVMFLALSGYWIESMETLYLVFVALLMSVAIGVPVGIWAASSERRTNMMQVVLDTFQVLPSFIYLIPVVMLFRVGPVAALFAILVYATVPAIRYTMLGLRNVPTEVIEAGKTSGSTRSQLLRKVRLPMAFPEIMLGANQTLLFGLLLVIIAAFIGGIEGLGDEILRARTEPRDVGEGLVAGFCVAAMGLTADQLINSYARRRKAQLGLD